MANVSTVEKLIASYPIVTDQITLSELKALMIELEAVLINKTEGEVVELGCYKGTASLFIRRLLDYYKSQKQLHVYDSFAGLPEKDNKDISPAGDQFKGGELFAPKSQLIINFKKAGLALPIIHKGWFSELTAEDLPNKVAFAFLDGDFYSSINDSLKVVWPRLVQGAVVVVDDYQNEALPGAAKAVDEWLAHHSVRQVTIKASLAIIRT